MQSLSRKMNFKMSSPIFIWSKVNDEKKEKITLLHMLLPKRNRVKKDDKRKEKTICKEEETTSDEPRHGARVIKLNWIWDEEQKKDEDPLSPGDIPYKQRFSSRGGKRLRY